MYIITSGKGVLSEIKEYEVEVQGGIVAHCDIVLTTDDTKALKCEKIGDAYQYAIKANKILNCNTIRVFEVNE